MNKNTGAPSHILIVDDEIQIRRLLRSTMETEGYRVTLAENGNEAIREAEMHPPDLIILDLGLPDIDGVDVLKNFRRWTQVPVIVLSARTDEGDIISALDSGANDYLTKPFRSGELIARIRTALRIYNLSPNKESVIRIGSLVIDLSGHTVTKNGQPVKLTPTEFSLLSLFVRNAGKVLTHSYLLQQVWGPKYEGESQYTRVYVGQLRKKLEDDPDNPAYFVTEAGIGYRCTFET
jgi:two-component system KDP operon response regulator KdpE